MAFTLDDIPTLEEIVKAAKLNAEEDLDGLMCDVLTFNGNPYAKQFRTYLVNQRAKELLKKHYPLVFQPVGPTVH